MLYRFQEYELDDRLYELRHTGVPVDLEHKVFDVLFYLLHHRDRVVPKEEILDKLWPGMVVGEAALTRCITAARKALGDDGSRQEVIKTQHGRGYHFVAAVTLASPGVKNQQEGVSSGEEEANQQTSLASSVKSQEDVASSQYPVVSRQ
jgi:DNA-binding winged helix-turn-helix (wHTH) protein